MLKVAAFTGGENASPARFRVRQYIDLLRSYDIDMKEFAAPLSSWPPGKRWLRPAWGVATLASRLPAITASHFYDVTLLQQSLVSTYVTLEGLTARPRILDVDDAIWAYTKRSEFVIRLAGLCDSIVCGNSFLADQFSKWNKNVVVIPTGVDTDYFCPSLKSSLDNCIIGWSGGSGGFDYLYEIESALKIVLDNNPRAILSIVADRKPDFKILPPEQVVFTVWSPANEVQTIQAMDIGIMPIDDSICARGKCSFKMLLYMACGKPVVVSPFGMNRDVLRHAAAGFAAKTIQDWVDSVDCLITNRSLRQEMGALGRQVVVDEYSNAVSIEKLAAHFFQYR
ncbi:MAG: glycosyltransferase family 4 protein [Thermodesulfobacteriota bacterium]|nr:glycosyltransferase family 4 protein [Thermodesulfobacteriota bacterium]